MEETADQDSVAPRRGSLGEVLTAFLKLGLTSFGGPIAHLGFFHDELVVRRKWIGEKGYADLVALCQFLPGPASSQIGFALGLLRAGPLGALVAFLAFTLPSALILIAFAYGAAAVGGPVGSGVLTGLKIVAVAIVAQAVRSMAKALCPDRERATIALVAVVITIAVAGALGHVFAIVVGAVSGLVFLRAAGETVPRRASFPVARAAGAICLALFATLLVGLPILAAGLRSQGLALVDSFYRAGSLVFGGGHVVLPLLEAEVVRPGWVTHDAFLAGYGAAQAVPGPLFTFAAYLGFISGAEPNGLAGAAMALLAVFLPGFLLLVGAIPFWDTLRTRPGGQALTRGASAAVVGILGAALYDPVFTSAIDGPNAFALALICFVLLTTWKTPSWTVVIAAALGGVVIQSI